MSGCTQPLKNDELRTNFEDAGFVVEETERGVVVYLPQIFFSFNSNELTLAARTKIEEAAELLNRDNTRFRQLSIEGHTDSVGEEAFNEQLSEERAQHVFEILAFSKVERQRMQAFGLGESQPLLPNNNADGSDNEENRERNRRVEIVILN